MSVVPSTVLLTDAEAAMCLATRDLSDPAHGPHAMQLVLAAVLDALAPLPVTVVRDHPVVDVADNYERLGYAADAVTRDARHSRYVAPGRMLRSHTTAMIPPALRRLADDPAAPRDVVLACPGLCWRRDAVDRLHTGTPHQLDVWRVADTGLGTADLHDLVATVVAAALPGARWRAVPAAHPYTEHGSQIDVLHDGEWVEVAECGLASARVLGDAGLRGRAGLAMGMGLDRLLMLRVGVPDIRLLRSRDPRIAGQLLDLRTYRPVSAQPPVRRDLSIVVGSGTVVDDEVIGDRVRTALGEHADIAETVQVRAVTPAADLPAAARERLRIAPHERNVVVRLVLRAVDRTLTDAEANVLRDRVYAALHEGPAPEWAATTRG